jgi:hypothetical protein
MEFRSVRIALTLVILLAIWMVVFACNSSPDVAKGPGASSTDTMALAADDPCDGTTNANRVEALQNYLTNGNMKDNRLNEQRNVNRYFAFNAQAYNANTDGNVKVLVRVYGRVVGQDDDDNNKPPKMKNFLKFLEKGMRKGCIDRVSFEPMPNANSSPLPERSQGDSTPLALSDPGFEWQSCVHPEFPCDTARCSVGQQCIMPKGTPMPSPSPSGSPKP